MDLECYVWLFVRLLVEISYTSTSVAFYPMPYVTNSVVLFVGLASATSFFSAEGQQATFAMIQELQEDRSGKLATTSVLSVAPSPLKGLDAFKLSKQSICG